MHIRGVHVDMEILSKAEITSWEMKSHFKFFKAKYELQKNTGRGVNQNYIWVGKTEDWVVQMMHKLSFNVKI